MLQREGAGEDGGGGGSDDDDDDRGGKHKKAIRMQTCYYSFRL
jgi:hypothetical protein